MDRQGLDTRIECDGWILRGLGRRIGDGHGIQYPSRCDSRRLCRVGIKTIGRWDGNRRGNLSSEVASCECHCFRKGLGDWEEGFRFRRVVDNNVESEVWGIRIEWLEKARPRIVMRLIDVGVKAR